MGHGEEAADRGRAREDDAVDALFSLEGLEERAYSLRILCMRPIDRHGGDGQALGPQDLRELRPGDVGLGDEAGLGRAEGLLRVRTAQGRRERGRVARRRDPLRLQAL